MDFTADGYRSTADRPEGGQDTFVTAGLVTNGPNRSDTLNFADVPNSLPNINVRDSAEPAWTVEPAPRAPPARRTRDPARTPPS